MKPCPTNYENSLIRLRGLLVKLGKDEEVLKECQIIMVNLKHEYREGN